MQQELVLPVPERVVIHCRKDVKWGKAVSIFTTAIVEACWKASLSSLGFLCAPAHRPKHCIPSEAGAG